MSEEKDIRDRIAYLRQLAVDSLNGHSGGFADLQRINQDVDSIIQSLEGFADPSWVNSLFREWISLETVYASVLADERDRLTQEEEDVVQETIGQLLTEFEEYDIPLSRDEKPREHDVVRLRRALSEHNLSAGSRGTVVVDYTQYWDGDMPPEYEVEFTNRADTTQTMVTVSEDDLEVVSRPGYGKSRA